MKLDEAIAAGLPLAVRSEDAGDRIMAAAFAVSGGVWFADVYWRHATSHAFHFLRGEVSGTGPWYVGDAEIRVIDHGDPRAGELNRWQAYLQTADGRLHTSISAWREIEDRML